MSNLFSAVVQAERMGAGLGGTFRTQAEQRRIRLLELAERLAMEAR
jgi:tight adherence protein C